MSLDEFFSCNLKKVAEIVYVGKGVSFNTIYSQGTWYTRSSIKKKFRKIFTTLLLENKDIRFIDKYVIDVRYNSRHDPDNIVAMEKMFIDTLRGGDGQKAYIKDDSKKYCKGVILRPDETLKTNTFVFTLYEWNADKE